MAGEAVVGLLLRAVEVDGPWRWRWLLTDEESGAPLADHQVVLDPESTEVAAFTGLDRYLRWQANPVERTASEAALVEQIGTWIGVQVLGSRVGAAIAAAAPVTVRVQVPQRAGFLLFAPLELAHVDGVPLARRGDVSLVFDIGTAGREKPTVAGRLRMVAVFSLPTDSSALALRRERYELTRMVRRLAGRQRRLIELEVLQYGVTRQLLTERMTADGGPDLLHLSGHGGTGQVLLETADGGADPVSTEELVGLLRPGRGRVRLTVLSACQSAAATTAETLRWLQLDGAADEAQAVADSELGLEPAAAVAVGPMLAGLAGQVGRELDCAVVAMRYPVVDDFAIALAEQFYEGLFSLDLPVDAALRRAVPEAAGQSPTAARPAISIATPTLFGAAAAGLSLTPPRGRPDLDPAEVRMAEFPDEPRRFVGRAGAMARASRALAPASEHTGVLLYGMAGAGKTACALELAYRHQNSFAVPVWWQAPLDPDQFDGALTSLAVALDRQLGDDGFAMLDKTGTLQRLRGFLPRLTQLLEDAGLLLVLDNLETLLTPAGNWRDPRWADLIAALTGHDGESRVVLTSRIQPAGLDARVRVESVHALSRDESALLARELPNLRTLLHADAGPTRSSSTATVDADRAQVRQVLHLVQGHPKLLELADAAARDPATLTEHLAAAEAAADGGTALAAFFTTGQSALDVEGFLHALAGWTASLTATMPEASQLLLQLLAGIEDDDRSDHVLEAIWPTLWQRLNRPGDPPEFSMTVTPLVDAALIQPEASSAQADKPPVRYRLHPGVADAVSAGTSPEVHTAIDTVLASYWWAVSRWAQGRPEGENTAFVVHADLSAAPYLIRLREWSAATGILRAALVRDSSPTVALAAAAHLRRVAANANTPQVSAALALAIDSVEPVEAQRLMRVALDQAVAERNHWAASQVAGDLINSLHTQGRLQEALELSEQRIAYARQAGAGPWTQLGARGARLQILDGLGRSEQVLAEVQEMLDHVRALPEKVDDNERTLPWSVREGILTTGVNAAITLRRWDDALTLAEAAVASSEQRGASEYEVAVTRYRTAKPLLALGRLDEAERVVLTCQEIYENANDLPRLSRALTVRSEIAKARGKLSDAAHLQRSALRVGYVSPVPTDIAMEHFNLANYLEELGGNAADQLAHRLAAAVLFEIIGRGSELDMTTKYLADELRRHADVRLPASMSELAARVELVEGVRFTEIVAALIPASIDPDRILEAAIQHARGVSPDDLHDVQQHLKNWEPNIILVVVAAGGDQDAAQALDPVLDQLAETTDWRELGATIRRILAGERDPDQLLAGLDPIDTAIVRRTLDALAGRITLNPPPDADEPSREEQVQLFAEVVSHAIAGNPEATDAVNRQLDAWAEVTELADLATAIRRVVAGDRDPESLLTDLDEDDVEIVQAVLTRLER